MINPRHHYWLAEDGRLFSGPLENIVTASDPGYVAFLAAGHVAARWMEDEAGNQTDAALQQAIGPTGMFVNLEYYTADVRAKKLVTDITVNGMPFATDPVTVMSLNAAYIYTQTNNGATFSWKLPDGSFITLNKADVQQLQGAVSSYGQACYACEDDTLSGIETDTITTRAQVDAAFAAIQSSFTGLLADGLKVRHGPTKTTKSAKKK